MPIFTSSPGDSSIGMNLAALSLQGGRLQIDTLRDVNETAAIVYAAKRDGGKSGVLILGGGSPKNFILQTEPQIQEVLGLAESGHDYFLQVTDARPDTGGTLRRDGQRGDDLGQGRPRQAPRLGDLLHRFHHRPAAADRLRTRSPCAATAPATLSAA